MQFPFPLLPFLCGQQSLHPYFCGSAYLLLFLEKLWFQKWKREESAKAASA